MKNFSAKTVLRVLMAFTGIFAITQMALSSGDVQFVSVNKSNKALLTLPQSQAGQARLTIVDQSENYIFLDRTIQESANQKKLLDLSNLDNGSYLLFVETNSGIIKKEFAIHKNILEIYKKAETFPPHVIKGADYLTLFFEGEGLGEIKVRFLQDGETVFTDDAEALTLKKKYDISKLSAGTYEVVLSAGTYSYTYDLQVN